MPSGLTQPDLPREIWIQVTRIVLTWRVASVFALSETHPFFLDLMVDILLSHENKSNPINKLVFRQEQVFVEYKRQWESLRLPVPHALKNRFVIQSSQLRLVFKQAQVLECIVERLVPGLILTAHTLGEPGVSDQALESRAVQKQISALKLLDVNMFQWRPNHAPGLMLRFEKEKPYDENQSAQLRKSTLGITISDLRIVCTHLIGPSTHLRFGSEYLNSELWVIVW